MPTKQYELSYILPPELLERDLKLHREEIEKIITGLDGRIISRGKTQRQRFAFPIKHKRQGYFAVINFNLLPQKIEKLDSELKLNQGLLRYYITRSIKQSKIPQGKKEQKEIQKTREKETRRPAEEPPKIPKTSKPTQKPSSPEVPKKDLKVRIEDLDKKLDDILEGKI